MGRLPECSKPTRLTPTVGARAIAADFPSLPAPAGLALASNPPLLAPAVNVGNLIGPVGLFIKGAAAARFTSQRIVAPLASPSKENLAALKELAESGKITPIIDRTYALSQVPDAIRYMETEHARAKVVITV